VVQDLMSSAGSAAAQYVLPAASFAEKDGCFVNHANLAQAIYWAVRPSGLGRTDGQVFLDLLERRGLFHAETLRQELAAEVPFFGPLKVGCLGEYGVRL
jgi:predicted molibdopterin-dependent oxidoreductase YjgC